MNNKKLKAIAITAAIIPGLVLYATIAVKFPIVFLGIFVTVTVGVGVYGIYKIAYLSLKD